LNLIDRLDNLDRTLFLQMNSWNTPELDSVMWYISHPVYWLPVYIIFILAARKKYGIMGILWLLIGIGVVVLLADNIHRECFKEVFHRLRPSRNSELDELVHLVIPPGKEDFYKGGKYGFISGHAANFTGIAIFVLSYLKLNRTWTIVILCWAALISFSRIYLGVHYPGDILGGTLLGIAVGFLANYLVKRFLIKDKVR
jgi:undecaprenyl-diphosphatase